MPHYLCKTCGVQYPPADAPPAACPICEDERQYVGHKGQEWLLTASLAETHTPDIRQIEPGLTGIGMKPGFAIGQRALLIQSAGGNVLWDCTPLLTDEVIQQVNALGGITAMAISHPHFYATMATWAETFDVPVYIHAAERPWVVEPHANVQFWDGDTHPLHDDMTLIRCGGHFKGGQVLHWPGGAAGKGALLTGDILFVTRDRQHVSFMYSFPNYIPLSPSKVRHITAMLYPYAYDRIYSAWDGAVLPENAKQQVAISAKRYIDAVTD